MKGKTGSKIALVLALGGAVLVACNPPDDGGTGGSGGGTGGAGARGGRGGSGGGGTQGGSGGVQGGSGGSGGTQGGSGGVQGGSGGSGGTGGSGGSGGAQGGSGGGSPDGGMEMGPAAERGLLTTPLMPFPMKISETGVFNAPPNFDMRPERVRFYVPDPPLYSDGLDKLRYILLPKDGKVDNTNPLHWKFPVGTIFIKSFLDGTGGKHPVETRFLRRVNEFSWQYATYKWNAEGTEAELAPNEEDRVPVMVNVAGKTFMHNIPSKADCGECHDNADKSNPDSVVKVIGFDELRLGGKATAASAKVQLDEFGDLGLFMAPVRPVAMRRTIKPQTNAMLKPVLDFVFGNCVHCHNASAGQFDMSPEVFVANTVNKPNMSQSVKPPDASYMRIVPRNPEKSIVFIQTRASNLPMSFRAMPPVGVQFPSQPMVDALRAWIMSL